MADDAMHSLLIHSLNFLAEEKLLMLSYQHGYHAGNFADVVKHLVLTRLLAYLTLKESPLFYLETHAGKGLYDLRHPQAQKTKEYMEGIQQLWSQRQNLGPYFHEYLKTIQLLNPSDSLRYYPGSPYLAANILRPQDRLYLCELHPNEYEELKRMPRFSKKLHCSNTDGLESMSALLPPQEKRGLIFIDPSFEKKEEYKTVPQQLKKAWTRFSTGVFCLWYPIVDKQFTDRLIRGLQEIPTSKTLKIEFHRPSALTGLQGCGLWVINPPYTLENELNALLNALKPILG